MTKADDPRLKGRHPEFCRMSLRPGIGLDAMHDVASVLMQFDLDTREADVPSALRHGSRTLPLGRYLRRYLRTLVGKDASAPQETLDAIKEKLQPLFEAAKSAPTGDLRTLAFKNSLIDTYEGSRRSLEARMKLKSGRKL